MANKYIVGFRKEQAEYWKDQMELAGVPGELPQATALGKAQYMLTFADPCDRPDFVFYVVGVPEHPIELRRFVDFYDQARRCGAAFLFQLDLERLIKEI